MILNLSMIFIGQFSDDTWLIRINDKLQRSQNDVGLHFYIMWLTCIGPHGNMWCNSTRRPLLACYRRKCCYNASGHTGFL